VSNASPEIDDIRRQMAQIRRDLDSDVQGVVEGVESVTDWRRIVRNYPWACVGVALAVGYFIVPRKHRTTIATLQVAPGEIATAASLESPVPVELKKSGKGLLRTAIGLVAPVAIRAVQGYALQFAEHWMAQKVAEQMQRHPDLAEALGKKTREPEGPRAKPPVSPRY
jgi:hypothetical protein